METIDPALNSFDKLLYLNREVFAMIADETWRRYVPECWLTSASGTEKVSSVTARRDATLYIKWTEAKAEGVASSKG